MSIGKKLKILNFVLIVVVFCSVFNIILLILVGLNLNFSKLICLIYLYFFKNHSKLHLFDYNIIFIQK